METCAHYLTISAEDVPNGATQFKCCPPIRSKENNAGLWQGLKAGTISMVTTDHSPSDPALKLLEEGNFLKAWGGIASLGLELPLMVDGWTGFRRFRWWILPGGCQRTPQGLRVWATAARSQLASVRTW